MEKTNIEEQLIPEAPHRRHDDDALIERLKFEQLLSELSAKFVNILPDKVDSEIDNVLKQVMEFFSVDLCALLEVNEDRAFARISHIVYGKGVGPISKDINLEELYPWTYKKLMRGEIVNITRAEDYPEEALIDRQSNAAMGTIARLAFPLAVNGRISRIITIHQKHQRHIWPEEYIPRLRLLGDILVNALERKRIRLRIDEQLLFETLLTEISGRFVNVPVERIDSEILDAQRRICECLKLDLSAMWQWSEEQPRIVTMTHLYRPLGGPPLPDPMYAHETFPWCQEELEAGRKVVVSSMDDVPAEAARDLETWRYVGIKSVVSLPISPGGGPIIGALSFDSMREERTWPEELVKRLELVAQIFTNALIRKSAVQALRKSEGRLRDVLFSMADWVWEMDEKRVYTYSSSKGQEILGNVIGKTPFDFMLPDEAKRVEVIFSERAANKAPIKDLENWNISKNGEKICFLINAVPLLDEQGNLKGYRGVDKDITGHKLAEQARRQSEARYRLLYESMRDAFVTVDLSGRIQEFNLAYQQMLGYPEEQLRNLSYNEITPQRWHAIEAAIVRDQVFARGYSDVYEKEYRRKDGSVFPVELRTFLINDDSGKPALMWAIVRDITERKQMENQLQERLQEIEYLKEKLEKENIYLREESKLYLGHNEIVGDSNAIKKVFTQTAQVAVTDSTVLILGETGTGKELLARAIHNLSSRKDRTLVTVNCASLPPTLIESELFGREKGAYTGALTRMSGRFETADGSTLFLDEIGELPLDLQSKLLRVLEHGIFERLGSTKTIQVNVRIIAATNRDLSRDVKEGKFRKDLFYRLNVFPITVPPLRERKEDIPALVWAFVREFEKNMGKRIDKISPKSMDSLMSYPWPGNIRELKNVIEHAMILNTTKTLDILPPTLTRQDMAGASGSLEDIERRHILEVLESTNWRISGKNSASELLGMKRTTLQSKMKVLGIKRPASS